MLSVSDNMVTFFVFEIRWVFVPLLWDAHVLHNLSRRSLEKPSHGLVAYLVTYIILLSAEKRITGNILGYTKENHAY